MEDIDFNALPSDLGFVLKLGLKEAVESLPKGRDCFCVLPKLDISAVCFGVKRSLQLANCFFSQMHKIVVSSYLSAQKQITLSGSSSFVW